MLQWISENGMTILVGLLVLSAVVAAVFKIIRDRKSGRGSCGGCGGGCGSCAMRGSCHNQTAHKK